MTYETIRLETDARGVARLTMIRADKHNAMNATMIRELAAAAKAIAGDGQIRAVILASEGKSFSAGADLTWMQEQWAKDRQGRIEEASVLARMLRSLDDLLCYLTETRTGQITPISTNRDGVPFCVFLWS